MISQKEPWFGAECAMISFLWVWPFTQASTLRCLASVATTSSPPWRLSLGCAGSVRRLVIDLLVWWLKTMAYESLLSLSVLSSQRSWVVPMEPM